MSDGEKISDEQLNALLDNELDAGESEGIFQTLAANPTLQQRYDELRRTKKLLLKAYSEVPQPLERPVFRSPVFGRYRAGFASAALLLLGISVGWTLSLFPYNGAETQIKTIAEIDVGNLKSANVLLHIGTADEVRVRAALQKAMELLDKSRAENATLHLEIVANAEGLNILRQGSPYAQEISALSRKFDNVQFLACGIAKKTAALKEGKPIKLLPVAKDIPAALDEILRRLQDGWTYVRG